MMTTYGVLKVGFLETTDDEVHQVIDEMSIRTATFQETLWIPEMGTDLLDLTDGQEDRKAQMARPHFITLPIHLYQISQGNVGQI